MLMLAQDRQVVAQGYCRYSFLCTSDNRSLHSSSMMARPLVIVAGMLMLGGAQGQSSMRGYDKFITPNLQYVKHGNGPDALAGTSPSADREEKQAVQKLLVNDSNSPITLSAMGIGLLSLVTMLGVHLRRGLQPATIPASSAGLDLPRNMS